MRLLFERIKARLVWRKRRRKQEHYEEKPIYDAKGNHVCTAYYGEPITLKFKKGGGR